MNTLANILFLDDDAAFSRHVMRMVKPLLGDEVGLHQAENDTQALTLIKEIQPEVAVVDLCLVESEGPESGIRAIEKLITALPELRILVLTGSGDTRWGVQALKRGASSFLSKPIDGETLLPLLKDNIAMSRLLKDARRLEGKTSAQVFSALGLSTKSPVMAQVLSEIEFAAHTKQPVLLIGETGVGKGVVAQAIHKASKRSKAPFLRIHPQYGSRDLISSELFGHLQGSFTGATTTRRGLIEEADGGTLFIDEIDLFPGDTQVSLLHVLQEGVFQKIGSSKTQASDFRLISATNRAKEALVGEDALRLDFYHRIAHLIIEIPPLRERREDIHALAERQVEQLAREEQDSLVQGLSKEAISYLEQLKWPGNVRELLSSVTQAFHRATFQQKRFISAEDFPANCPRGPQSAKSLEEQIKEFEAGVIKATWVREEENQSRTAKALGIDRKRVRRALMQEEQR